MATHVYCTEVTGVRFSSHGLPATQHDRAWGIDAANAHARYASYSSQSAAAFAAEEYLRKQCGTLHAGERQTFEVTVSVWIEGQNRARSYRVEYRRGLTQARKPQLET